MAKIGKWEKRKVGTAALTVGLLLLPTEMERATGKPDLHLAVLACGQCFALGWAHLTLIDANASNEMHLDLEAEGKGGKSHADLHKQKAHRRGGRARASNVSIALPIWTQHRGGGSKMGNREIAHSRCILRFFVFLTITYTHTHTCTGYTHGERAIFKWQTVAMAAWWAAAFSVLARKVLLRMQSDEFPA